MSEYKRQKVIQYKVQHRPDKNSAWKDLYSKHYSYWQAEMIVLYYKEWKGMDVQSIPVEISG